ncbi:hypothetical protein FFI39_009370 [Janthinobacterium sp. KBS0711]|uniref:hypothetical protein n=1 Tax=Janthinobacterium sp. KBS0711 TaxID=1649647 RepID=UPI00110E47B9|nr:hypothetical protein [Janthinobacterium sp. KBS0711]TSD71186.1 hypothetical protein FFI39_009370 [Janthinobacterium sp. KBS0711]
MINKNLEDVERQENEIRHHIHRQILGISDQVRSKEIWLRILATANHETIATALSTQLTHFKYHEISSAKFCCQQIRP